MSKSSGTADEILNLPSGGSVSGSGTSFSVDLNTGTVTAALQFALPAGPNGIIPQISLQYSTGTGDGPFGSGWSLGTLAVLREITPSAGAPDPTAPGTYSMSGIGELVDMGGGRYRPTVDTTGQLIEFADGSWTVTDNRDTKFTLGTTAASQIGADPPAAWILDSCSDSSGNTVHYTWLSDSGSTAARHRQLGHVSTGVSVRAPPGPASHRRVRPASADHQAVLGDRAARHYRGGQPRAQLAAAVRRRQRPRPLVASGDPRAGARADGSAPEPRPTGRSPTPTAGAAEFAARDRLTVAAARGDH